VRAESQVGNSYAKLGGGEKGVLLDDEGDNQGLTVPPPFPLTPTPTPPPQVGKFSGSILLPVTDAE
jgi:hypothetical protein